ncbi:hypothetical protein D3C83_150570 [compost metagenome]
MRSGSTTSTLISSGATDVRHTLSASRVVRGPSAVKRVRTTSLSRQVPGSRWVPRAAEVRRSSR